jgi:tetratricopeptide (TPR) repeat protein
MKIFILAAYLATLLLGVPGEAPGAPLSPAERRIEAAQRVLRKQPTRYQAYNELALALIRRARETGDSSYCRQAEQAIATSFRIKPDNFEAAQAHVALLLAERRYHDALEQARALNHTTPDSVLIWGYMAEAEAALGNYAQAEKAAQWMMDLRPGNVPAFLCGASLREDWGDKDGALDFLSKALQETPPIETEETAWILSRMAGLYRTTGKPAIADRLLQEALKIFPGYYLALEELTRVRMAEHRGTEAVELIKERNRNTPTAESRHLEAEALERAGRLAEARLAYSEFEQQARRRIDQPDNANRELVLYYAGPAHQPAEALRIARLQVARRHDVWTLDAYAWSLYSNGEYAAARRQMEKALSVGTRDPVLFYHAGEIAAALRDKDGASRYLKQSLSLDPASEVAAMDQRALSELDGARRDLRN